MKSEWDKEFTKGLKISFIDYCLDYYISKAEIGVGICNLFNSYTGSCSMSPYFPEMDIEISKIKEERNKEYYKNPTGDNYTAYAWDEDDFESRIKFLTEFKENGIL